MTQFEQAQQDVKDGKIKTPSVAIGAAPIDYFAYQLATHHFNLKIMASGMTFRAIKLTDIKRYYGLKGRTAKDCLGQFETIYNDYKEKMKKAKEAATN